MGIYGPMGARGFQRRGRRRGLIVGAAVGAAAARRGSRDTSGTDEADLADNEAAPLDYSAELTRLKYLYDQHLISEEEYDAKKKQILGI